MPLPPLRLLRRDGSQEKTSAVSASACSVIAIQLTSSTASLRKHGHLVPALHHSQGVGSHAHSPGSQQSSFTHHRPPYRRRRSAAAATLVVAQRLQRQSAPARHPRFSQPLFPQSIMFSVLLLRVTCACVTIWLESPLTSPTIMLPPPPLPQPQPPSPPAHPTSTLPCPPPTSNHPSTQPKPSPPAMHY